MSNMTIIFIDPLDMMSKFEMVFSPILVVFGILGNIFSVAVFFGTKLRLHSSSYYLTALAISDSGFLITILITWLALIDVPSFHVQGVCQATIYISSLCSFISVWMVVAFTTERFIAVRYPLLRSTMCTVRRAKGVIFAISLIGLALYMPQVFISAVQYNATMTLTTNTTTAICELNPDFRELGNTLNNIDTVLTLILPFAGISIVNTIIALTVIKLAKHRKTLTSVKCLSKPLTGGNPIPSQQSNKCNYNINPHMMKNSMKAYRSAQTKITNMLLIVSTVFLVLNLPSYVIRLYIFFQQKETSMTNEMILAQHIAQILFNTNFGINFALYCISGQNFRRELYVLICRGKTKRSENSRITTVLVSDSRRSTTSPRRQTMSHV